MLYNIHRWNPKLIAIPDIGIGLMWGSLGNVVAFYAYTFTNSASGIAKIQSLATVVGVFTQIIIGILSDKTHHKWGKRTPWIVYGTLLASASICIWPFVHSFIAFLIMVGITCTLVNVVQCTYYTMLIEVVDSNQIGYANTLARTAGNLGGLFMGVLAGFLWNHQHPQYTFFAMAAIMAASTLFVVPGIIKERPENYIAHKKLSFSIEFFTNKNVLGLFVITFLFFASNTVIIQMGTSIFVKSYHFSENTIGKLGMLQSIASLIYGVAVFKLIDKFNHKYILSISALGLCATYFYFFLFLHQGVNLLVLYAGVFVYGLFFIAGIICIYTIGSMVAPKDRLGEFIGWINIFIALPQTIFVYVFGYIIDVGHPHLPLFIAAIFYLIAFGVTMLLKLKSPNELS